MSQALTLEHVSLGETRISTNAVETSCRLTLISQQRIKNSKYFEVRTVQCEVCSGILFLRGQVSSYFLKQLAQETVRFMEGIRGITKDVVVAYPGSYSNCSSHQTTMQ